MRAILFSIIFAVIIAATVVLSSQPRLAAQHNSMGGMIRVSNDDIADDSVFVTVLRAGTIIKSSDCTANHMIEWENVPEGDYDVRFEAAGKMTVIKKIHLGAGDTTVLSAKLPEGKGALAMGSGPTISELDARLKKVEAALVKTPAKAHNK